MNEPKFIIVVGTSAGGLNALTIFLKEISPQIDAAIFIVMHLSPGNKDDFLLRRLKDKTKLSCELAKNGASIKKGCIYIASPNLHLLVKKGSIILGRGPEENRWRPSIDVLFRSAAASYNTRVIGVILTGLLDDGTTGMLAIKRSGGICIVQDPDEAEYPGMPLAVMNNMEVDYTMPLTDMGELLLSLTKTVPEEKLAPRDVVLESEIAERVVVDYDNVKQIGEKSIYACPDCGGCLWTIAKGGAGEGKIDRYRCHIGHSYSEQDLIVKQGKIFESTLWTALRIMEERRNLLMKIEDDHIKRGSGKLAKNYRDKADKIQIHVDKMKEVLFASQEDTYD